MEQTTLDLDGKTLESQWRRNEIAQAEDWTEEAKCISWIWPKTYWRHHKEWWDKLPEYKRRSYLSMYEFDSLRVPVGSWPPRRSFASCMAE